LGIDSAFGLNPTLSFIHYPTLNLQTCIFFPIVTYIRVKQLPEQETIILTIGNWLDHWMVVVCYWSISCEWQVAPPLRQ